MVFYLSLYSTGALTLRSSLYSYRSWEYNRVELVDIFDANGSSVLISSYGLEIYRICSNMSLYNSNWCTDKVRYVGDFLYINRIYYSFIMVNKYMVVLWKRSNLLNLSYIFLIKYIFKFLFMFNLDKLYLYSVLYFYCISDNYVSSLELNKFTIFLKLLDCYNVSSYKYTYLLNVLFFLSVLKLLIYIMKINRIVVFICLLIYYEYPYLLLLLFNRIYLSHVIGIVLYKRNYLINKGLCVISYMFYILCMNIDNYNIHTYYCYSSLIYKSYISVYMLNSFYILIIYKSLYYNYIFLFNLFNKKIYILWSILYMLSSYNICNNFTILMLYNNIYLNIINLCLFNLDIKLFSAYIMYNFDYYANSSSFYQIYFCSFLYKVFICMDVVVPLYLFIEVDNININYYGSVVYTSKIIYIGSMYCIDMLVNFLLVNMFNKYIFEYIFITLYLYIINICRYNIVYIIFILVVNYINKLTIYLYNYLLLFILCRRVLIDINIYLMYKLFINIKYFNYLYFNFYQYVDKITYFLTGSACKISLLLSRYRICLDVDINVYSL